MMTIKQFCEQSNIPAKLIRSVIRQMGGWDSFKESAQDVTNYGISGGFHGFCYYNETTSFVKRNKAAIMELCREQAREYGMSGSVSEFVAGFNCFKGYLIGEIESGLYYANSEYKTFVYNALAWFAAEEVCRAYCDILENDGD